MDNVVQRIKIYVSHPYFEFFPMRTERSSKGVQSFVKFEVFMALTIKNAAFWDAKPCGSSKKRHFAET
jgi:hypothetical protein